MKTALAVKKAVAGAVIPNPQPVLTLVVRKPEEGMSAVAERYTFPVTGAIDKVSYASPAPGAGKIEAGVEVRVLEKIRATIISPGHLFKGDTEYDLVRVNIHPTNWYFGSAFGLP